MKRLGVLLFLSLSSSALADIAVPPQPAPAAAPAPAPAPDALKTAATLVESGPNTVTTLKEAIAMYEGALGDTTRPAADRAKGWADLARAYLRLGDLLTADKDKIATYEKGKAAGEKAVDVAGGRFAAGRFWATANLAVIGRTRGVMNSLFMLGDLRKGLNEVLSIDANFHLARNTLGEIDHAVPGIAGGSDDRAEKSYLEVLRRDPHFTATMVLLAKLKRDQGNTDEARQWADRVVKETSPSVLHDHRKFDVRDAKAILAELK
jgi:tetratricopeptide (TPR) repeat protein